MQKISFHLQSTGIGDAVCGLYAACGLADAGIAVTYHARHLDWLRRVNHPNLTIEPFSKDCFDAAIRYGEQLADTRTENITRTQWYVRNVVEKFRILQPVAPARPKAFSLEGLRPPVDTPYVLLSPFSNYNSRVWPLSHWRRLGHFLREAGYGVVAIGGGGDAEKLSNGFRAVSGAKFYWGQRPDWVLGAVKHADLVIGNDSGMAHVAGLLGTPALAIMAQLRPEVVFSDAPTVKGIVPEEDVPCRLCHWNPAAGYKAAHCEQECSALTGISTGRVLKAALGVLSEVVGKPLAERTSASMAKS